MAEGGARAVTFECRGARLVGIAHVPADASPVGVLLVVGGPQYRVGSHRQFVLLSRALAAAGHASLRFDYRGMGDSDGDARSFDSVNDDLAAAADALVAACPNVRRIVLWGLCDAASAALIYAGRDRRVTGLVLLNPWVRSTASLARARVRHYYLLRLVDPAFWGRLVSGEMQVGRQLRAFIAALRGKEAEPAEATATAGPPAPREDFIDRMHAGFARFERPVLFVVSGRDLTAQEWLDTTARERRWQRPLARATVRREDLAQADHTFSTRAWRDEVASLTVEFLRSLPP